MYFGRSPASMKWPEKGKYKAFKNKNFEKKKCVFASVDQTH